MANNEKELIVASQQGDSEAFGMLYDLYIKKMYNFIFYKTFHKETAEDLTSQTFLKALSNIQSVDPDRPFNSWLYKIAQNIVVDHYRSRKITDDLDETPDISDEHDVVHSLDAVREAGKVREYLKRLSDEEQNIIILRVWQDMPYKEIADTMGKTEASCKMMYSRAIAKLRTIMSA